MFTSLHHKGVQNLVVRKKRQQKRKNTHKMVIYAYHTAVAKFNCILITSICTSEN